MTTGLMMGVVGRYFGWSIEAEPPLSEVMTREGRQPLQEAAVGRQLPVVLDLIRPARRVHEIEWPVTDTW